MPFKWQKLARSDWNDIKEQVMYRALVAKFTQNPQLTKVLISTKERLLVEHTRLDRYWGDGGNDGEKQIGISPYEG